MRAQIISIGDELLIGQTVNTNAAWMGQLLSEVGVQVVEIKTISDGEEEILSAMLEGQRFDLVLITGGLGPTKDDVTKKSFASYFKVGLVQDDEVLAQVEGFFKRFNRTLQAVNMDQAKVPEGSTVLMNKKGTAPGMWMEKDGTVFVSMPGVPREMKYLMEYEVVPRLQERFSLSKIEYRFVMTHGIGESYIAERIAKIEEELPEDISLSYLPSRGVVKLRLSSRRIDGISNASMLEAIQKRIAEELNEHVFALDDKATLSSEIGKLLLSKEKTIAVAESITSGAVAKELTGVSGASNYFVGGVAAYQYSAKQSLLGVDANLLATKGAVNGEVALAMAKGVRASLGADYAIATTGIAGPDSDEFRTEVGTVWIAIVSEQREEVKCFQLGEGRADVSRRATMAALGQCYYFLLED